VIKYKHEERKFKIMITAYVTEDRPIGLVLLESELEKLGFKRKHSMWIFRDKFCSVYVHEKIVEVDSEELAKKMAREHADHIKNLILDKIHEITHEKR
jgi:hypothetical protein